MPTLSDIVNALKGAYEAEAAKWGNGPKLADLLRRDPATKPIMDYPSNVAQRAQALSGLLTGREPTPQQKGLFSIPDVTTPQGALDMAQNAPMGLLGHIVYHGSPHKFNAFDMSKIGTGEGAQAYGHGLYFAESPEVAKRYQAALSRPDSAALSKADDIAAWAHSSGGGDKAESLRYLTDEISRLDAYGKFGNKINRDDYMQALDILNRGKAPTGGAMYKVDIPDEAIPKMLDWDKPLSEQPELLSKVQQMLNDLGELYPSVGNVLATPQIFDGQHLYQAFINDERSSERAARSMKAIGIPGINYLDGSSRGTGQGTSNYVLFDDQLPRILEVNGQPTGLQPWGK